MLIYHPAFDVNHGVFRMLRLLEANTHRTLNWDTFRIIDIYYLFPYLLENARLPRSLSKQKRLFSGRRSRYSQAPTPKIFIHKMVGIHATVGRSLIAKGLLEADAFANGSLKRTSARLPASISDAFANATDDQALVDFLAKDLAEIPSAGANGLKDRTGLLEHYYDAN